MRAVGNTFVRSGLGKIILFNFLIIFAASCEKESVDDLKNLDLNSKQKTAPVAAPYEFSAPVYDIASTPDGSILVGLNDGEMRSIEVIKNGEIRTMAKMDVASDINGIATIGAGNAFVTTAGSDLAQTGELYRVSYGNYRMVADLAAFERQNDPDAFAGPQWKNQLCEATGGFSAGPQNNPYKVAALSGGVALVADAAGNTLLSATTSGEVDWKALFTPPVDENGDWMQLFTTVGDSGEITCYVQPVPTSVAIGPDGYIYVGELTGAVAGGIPTELSRVWKIPADASHVVCTVESGDCELLIDELTSVIDLAIGPDGLLYVVEFDEGSWFASFDPASALGGTISAYELNGELVEVVAQGLSFPSAITFDKKGNLWVLENNNVVNRKPTVRMLDYRVE